MFKYANEQGHSFGLNIAPSWFKFIFGKWYFAFVVSYAHAKLIDNITAIK